MARIVVVTDRNCGACKSFLKQLERNDISEALKTTHKSDKIEVLDIQKDALAVNIVASLETYAVPVIAVLREEQGKTQVCQLDEKDLAPKKCVDLRELPP